MRRGNASLYSSAANAAVMEDRAAYAASLVPPVPVPAAIDPLTLPTMQQAALMQMHESIVKRAIIARLLEDAQDKPEAPDYAALQELGLAERRTGYRFRTLTADGSIAARDLEQALCKRFDLHLLLGPFGAGPTVSFRCPCGWSTTTRNSHTAPGNGRSRWNAHVATGSGLSKLVVALQPPERVGG